MAEKRGNSILDFLSQIIARPGQGQDIVNQQQPLLPSNNNGLVQGAADTSQLYPMWQKLNMQAQINGQQFPSFLEWMQQEGIQAPSNLPR